jgi:group I intron endonuclease
MAVTILAASGIYAITNKVNGKKYIGSACHLKNRWKTHKSRLNLGQHHSAKLQNAWRKHGSDSFTFDVIEYVDDKNDLIAREQDWIDHYNAASPSGYNVSPTAGNCLGVRHGDEVKAARSAILKGRTRAAEVCAKISAAKLAKSEDEKRLISARVSAALKARTAEAKAESAARAVETKRARGNLKSRPDAVERQRAAITGRKLTPEAIAKRSATVIANALKRRQLGVTRKYVRK